MDGSLTVTLTLAMLELEFIGELELPQPDVNRAPLSVRMPAKIQSHEDLGMKVPRGNSRNREPLGRVECNGAEIDITCIFHAFPAKGLVFDF